jgi:hypothetical protein
MGRGDGACHEINFVLKTDSRIGAGDFFLIDFRLDIFISIFSLTIVQPLAYCGDGHYVLKESSPCAE